MEKRHCSTHTSKSSLILTLFVLISVFPLKSSETWITGQSKVAELWLVKMNHTLTIVWIWIYDYMKEKMAFLHFIIHFNWLYWFQCWISFLCHSSAVTFFFFKLDSDQLFLSTKFCYLDLPAESLEQRHEMCRTNAKGMPGITLVFTV